ncbi:poly(A)-specific ribonuclease PARN-like isoform X2 [Cryptomeria japonica]|uniref:poly(A)-specific ribonuclease PARN-like isoform X2 n=1 Tax=Cryptomeria japonica TaxID=3369 RepID=UPI0027DA9A7D|nr:poly(A)-specific ribonuclease PARN-like isoform X2 [Cryptomeria japonica]XP_057831794.2 poly(A)-specific ribonuclease PARN-like isoform X2 [Cryptomeria japonica]
MPVQVVRYNFHLFPRDELRVGMPSYSFLCQISLISSMAQKGFDFNSCVYEGISYLSRAQEASLMQQYGSTRMFGAYPASSFQNKSTADINFMERIRFQMQHWIHACSASSNASEGRVVSSIETIALNNEIFGTRPCLRIDATSNHQVQLILEVLRDFTENLVPLSSSNGVGTEKELKVVFTCSEEDKHHLLSELQHQAEHQGIRDVINTIINSRKTIVGYNCLTDLAIIYSNFIAPLPATVKEFLYSLHGIFPHLLDVSHLLKEAYSKEISPTKKAKNLQAALLHLNKQFFLPMNLEVPLEFKCYGYRGPESHGYTALRLTYLFAKVCRLLKINSSNGTTDGWLEALVDYAGILYRSGTCLNKSKNEGEVVKLMGDSSYLKTSNIIFIWGFKIGSSSRILLEMLCNIHKVCEKGVKVQLVDESCAYVRFKKSRYAEIFLQDVQSGTNISGFAKSKPLEEITKMGLKAVRYDVYEKLCKSSIWKSNLADSFKLFMSESDDYMAHNFTMDIPSRKNSSFIIELEDL